MNGDPDRLEDLARRVTDGTPIDWEAAEHAAETPDDRATIRGLRLLARIAEAVPGGDAAGTWGPLELLERIAEGSFGQVWRARDTRLDREVALKLFPEEVSRRRDVLEEGRMLARVRHPNVVTVYGAEIHSGRVGIWMELVKGVSLEDRLREQGPLGADEALLVGIDLCRALAAVHAVGLVHGDVKAVNVLREEGGRIVLADFGAGSRSGPGTASGTVAGTPLYLAPELLRGGERTPSADLYATGVLLAHLATGGYPVSATSLEELIAKHGQGERASLRDLRPDLPDGFVAVVERATAHEPSGRIPSAGAMERALRESLGAGLRLRRRRALGWTAGAVVAVLAAVLGWSAWLRGGVSVDADWVRVRDDGMSPLPT